GFSLGAICAAQTCQQKHFCASMLNFESEMFLKKQLTFVSHICAQAEAQSLLLLLFDVQSAFETN
ncbi:hypothetical protein, partial [Escherichia coli]|uniref:hypothetical protein n=1 Tax=Escherichia coli TaxID=562 RepID=UPI00197E7950